MSEHVIVETSFLHLAFHLPHKRDKDALVLWDRFKEGELSIHVPFLCFQEAQRTLQARILSREDPTIETQEIRRYLVGMRQGPSELAWNDSEVAKFFDEVNRYLVREKTDAFRMRLSDALGRLRTSCGVIDGETELFVTMPLDVDHQLEYNDHLVLASVLHRARTIREESDQAAIYFCSKDSKHLRPGVDRPKLTKLYNDLGIIFQDHFTIP